MKQLKDRAGDQAFLTDFRAAKRHNKEQLAGWISEKCGVSVDPDAMFDVQIKRIHEYKRQFMNILETIALWNEMRDEPNRDWTPRVKIFGGKAAPGYHVAKRIVHLINDVAKVINSDPATADLLKVVFPPNYNVTMAEQLIPGCRSVRTNLNRRQRSVRHREHEIRPEWRFDDRHSGRGPMSKFANMSGRTTSFCSA